jgi:hypothetical protein
MVTRRLRLWMLTLFLIHSSVGNALAQYRPAETAVPGSVPSGISYQGRLEESGVVVSGTKNMRFRLFDLATGGFALYDSGAQNVDLNGGVFSVVLPIPLGALVGGSTRYIEVEIEGTVLTPRDPLTSVPYAKVAEAIEGDIEISTGGFHVRNPAGTVLFVSSVTAQIGIGTSVPASGARLHVIGGDVVIGSTDSLGGGTANEDLFVEGNVVVDGAVSFAGGSFSTLAVATTTIADPGQQFKVGVGTFTVMEGGQVGLGTTNPLFTLDIQARGAPGAVLNHATQPQIRLDRAGVQQLLIDHDGTLGTLGTISATDLVFEANSTERMRVLSGGNVGIGVTNPSRLLDVNGTLRATTLETSALGTQAAPTIILGGDADTGVFAPAGGNNFAITTGGTERLRVDSSGNVGIGATAAAGQRLRVDGGDVVIGNPVIAGGSGQEDLFIEGNLVVDGQAILQSAQFTDLGISTAVTTGQLFKIGRGTFTVLEGGNVGIGTTNPAAPLDIQANAIPGVSINHATNPRFQLRRAATDVLQFEHDGTLGTVGTQTASNLILETFNTARVHIIDATGRVGISSAVPTATLSVGGNANVQGALTIGSPLTINLGGTGQTSSANARTALGAVDRAGTEATTNSTWGIKISSTAAEATQLENDPANCVVAGEFAKGVDAQGVPTCVNVAVNEEGTFEALVYDNNNNLDTIGGPWSVAASGANDIRFDVANDTFVIDVSANEVGIGTTNPSQKLDVQGGSINTSGKLREGGNALVPANTVMMFNLASCPSGWTEHTAARGRALVGMPAAGTLGGTVGTALTNLATISHTHTMGNHTHDVDPDGGGHTHGLNSHTHSVNPDGAGHTHGLNSHTHDTDPDGGGHSHTLSAHTHSVNPDGAGHLHGLNSHTHTFDPGSTASGVPSATGADAGAGGSAYGTGVHTHSTDIAATASGGPSTANTVSTNLGSVTSAGPSTANTSSTNLGSATSGGPSTANTTSTNLGSVTSGTPSTANSTSTNLGTATSGAPSTNNSGSTDHTTPYLQLLVCEKS